MNALPTILMAFAFVCFALATSPLGRDRWNQLVSAGLAFWCFVVILGYAGVWAR